MDNVHYWVHYGFVIFGAVLTLISFVVQFREPATYGKHEDKVSSYKEVTDNGATRVELTDGDDVSATEQDSITQLQVSIGAKINCLQ